MEIYIYRFPEHQDRLIEHLHQDIDWTPDEEINVELNSRPLTKLTTSNWNIRI